MLKRNIKIQWRKAVASKAPFMAIVGLYKQKISFRRRKDIDSNTDAEQRGQDEDLKDKTA